jgi:hypothetical protein
MKFAARRLLVVCLAAAAARCSNIDVVTASYASRSEARASGAIDRGWIPAWIPESAEGIREAHDLDSNRRWGLFDFAPGEADAIRAALDPSSVSLTGIECGIPGRIEWWPLVLRGSLDAGKIRDAALEAYRTKAGSVIVVVNWKQGRAYYWAE